MHVNNINFAQSSVNTSFISFKANVSTRQILNNIDSDEYSGLGHARIQKETYGKRACRESFKERVGEYLVFRSCKRKHRYETDHEAIKAMRQMVKKKQLSFDIYECPLCDGWHICKSANKIKRAILF